MTAKSSPEWVSVSSKGEPPEVGSNWRNRLSMPKVRASSATIGTTSGPTSESLTRFLSILANAIVVDTGCPREPARKSENAFGSGVAGRAGSTTRDGTGPARTLRLATR